MKKIMKLLIYALLPFVMTACGADALTQESGSDLTSSSNDPKSPAPAASQEPKEQPPEVAKAEVFVKLDGTVTAGILFDDKGSMIVSKNGGLIKINSEGQVSDFCSYEGLERCKDYYFKSPLSWDMLLDPDGNILAAAQDRILKISETGEITTLAIEEFEGFLGASGIEQDEQGNLYVTNGGRIMRYTKDMEATTWLNGNDSGFHTFFSLKFSPDGKTLYATDFDTSSLVKIPVNEDGSSGQPVLIISEPIPKARPYGAPLNMVFGESGNLYASLDCRWQLLKLNQEGNTELLQMPMAGENHYIAFGGRGFDEMSIYFTTFAGKAIYRYPLGEKANSQ